MTEHVWNVAHRETDVVQPFTARGEESGDGPISCRLNQLHHGVPRIQIREAHANLRQKLIVGQAELQLVDIVRKRSIYRTDGNRDVVDTFNHSFSTCSPGPVAGHRTMAHHLLEELSPPLPWSAR
jgi:hypothetical protein